MFVVFRDKGLISKCLDASLVKIPPPPPKPKYPKLDNYFNQSPYIKYIYTINTLFILFHQPNPTPPPPQRIFLLKHFFVVAFYPFTIKEFLLSQKFYLKIVKNKLYQQETPLHMPQKYM